MRLFLSFLLLSVGLALLWGCSQPATDLDKALLEVAGMEDERLLGLFVPENCLANTDADSLSRAAAQIQINLATLLLDAGAHVDAQNAEKRTPLMIAAERNRGFLAAKLLRGARLESTDVKSAYTLAKEAGNADVATLLYLARAYQITEHPATRIDDLLYSACLEGSASAVSYFLDLGADIEGIPNARHLSRCAQTTMEGTRILLERGADINAFDDYGRPAIFWAIGASLNEKNLKEYLGTLQVLVDYSKNINDIIRMEYTEDTVLSFAVAANKKEAVEFLLKAGADPNLEYRKGNTAFKLALFHEHKEILPILIRYGADLNRVLSFESIPLEWAMDAETISLLVQNGANVNFVYKNGESLLMRTVRQRDLFRAKALIEHGADIHYVSPDGKTAFSLAEGEFVPLLKNAMAGR